MSAGGGYRGTGLLTIPHYRRHQNEELSAWKEDHNASPRKVRARNECTFVHMRAWKILRECQLKGDGIHHASLGIVRSTTSPSSAEQETALANPHAIGHVRDNRNLLERRADLTRDYSN